MWSYYDRFRHVTTYWLVRAEEKLGLYNKEDKIADYLYLSSLPMRGDEENLIKKVGASNSGSLLVVSAVEKYENHETMFWMDPVRPIEWKKTFKVDDSEVKVDHIQLVMKDFEDGKEINIQSAAEIVLAIQQFRNEKKSVLVHCKAGRTRSAMLVACVLALYDLGQLPENATKSSEALIDLAVKFIHKYRPQINVPENVQLTAIKIVNMVKNILRGEEKLEEPLRTKIDRLAINPLVKDTLKEVESYLKLRQYRDNAIIKTGALFSKVKPVKRAEHIDKFMGSVESFDKHDGSWLTHLMCKTGPIREFLDADPYTYFAGDRDEDKRERARLIAKLKEDVEKFICKNLECSLEQLRLFFPVMIPEESKPVPTVVPLTP
jgi:hypothetical protein